MVNLNKEHALRVLMPTDKRKIQRYFAHNYIMANAFMSHIDVAKVTRRSSGLS